MRFTGKSATGALVACIAATWLATSPAAQSARDDAAAIALEYAQREKQQLGLTGSDINDVAISSIVVSKQSGATTVHLQQRYRGIDVRNGLLSITVGKDGRVISAGNRFVQNIASRAGGQNAQKVALEAASAAAGHLKLQPKTPLHVLERKGGPSDFTIISDGGIAEKPIEARLVWAAGEDRVRLAWLVQIDEASGDHWWDALVDAETGALIETHDRVVHDSAPAIAAAVSHPAGLPAALASFPPTDGATYNVFALGLESPSDGDRTLVTNAPNPAASPFGWHDTDGASGPEFMVTRGNNVHAYADRDNNNTPDPGSDPSGGSSLAFDFPLNLAVRPFDSQPAIVTNLFYWNNLMHDITHGYGFDEPSGNFQVNTYGNGGVGSDYVRAEAQDGSGRNNANFGTDVDGVRPRMQMFEWRSALPNPITVAAPSPIAGTYFGPMAGFGESLVTTGPISGPVVLVNDGAGTSFTDGCEPFTVPPGAIPLADRGSCNFTIKVKNAQNAGAAVAIIANNIAGSPVAMGGSDPTITIPSVMISLDDANLFKANLPLNVTVADGTGGAPDRDSDLDAGVIAHEYGHGISNRLTGGPATVACLRNAEQMGEGWSDWFAMTFTAHPSDTPTTARGVGTYVSFEPPEGAGIRPTPYSTDMAVNPSTYASVADTVNISQPHGIGYVWNTMLWEMYWNLVDKHGFNPDIYGAWTTGGNNLAVQLVMDGMKMQVCSPGFVDGRNAILAADTALTGGANQCEIWRAFAKRGLGASASQGLSSSRTDGAAAFDLPASCTAASFGEFEAPVFGPPTVNPANAGSTIPVKFTLAGDDDPQIDSQAVNCTTLEPTGEAPTAIDSPGSTTLSQYGDAFQINWQTDAAWAGSCRRLTVRIPAASNAVAYFQFY